MVQDYKLADYQKILLVTAIRVGDAIFITPAIKLLKQALPNVEFSVLALGPGAAEVYKNNPAIHDIHLASNVLTAGLIADKYPLVINLMHEMKPFLKKIKVPILSIGKPDEQKARAQQVIDYVLSLLPKKPVQIDKNYHLYPKAFDEEAILKLFKEYNIDPSTDILIGCQLGCHRVARRGWKFWQRDRHMHKKVWPIENYIALIKKISAISPRIKIILTGSPQETFLAKMVQKEIPNINSFIGKTDLLQLVCLVAHFKVLITHDTGTLHIACSQQIPLVTLFGPTPVSFTGPYPMQPQYKIIQKESMADITVQEVVNAVTKQLSDGKLN